MSKKWELCPALVQFRKQINLAVPGRGKISDGTIGDASHSARSSDHNPNDAGFVCAMDVTNDVKNGIAGQKLVDTLTKNPDKRINYIIFNAKITRQGTNLQEWKPYHGTNAHRHHVHISIHQDAKLYNNTSEWNLDDLADGEHIAKVLPEGEHLSSQAEKPALETGMVGQNVPANVNAPSNQQNVNDDVPEEKPKPYNDIGLKDTLVNDAKAVIPANTGINIMDAVSQASGLPLWAVKIVTILAIAIGVCSVIWLGYRLISFLVHVWRENERIKLKTLVNTDVNRKSIS